MLAGSLSIILCHRDSGENYVKIRRVQGFLWKHRNSSVEISFNLHQNLQQNKTIQPVSPLPSLYYFLQMERKMPRCVLKETRRRSVVNIDVMLYIIYFMERRDHVFPPHVFAGLSNYPNCGLSFCPIKASRLYHSRSTVSVTSLSAFSHYWDWEPGDLDNEQLKL